MINHQRIIVIDYGSQYTQLICRRVREAQVYAEILSWEQADDLLPGLHPAGIILSGGPNSVYEPGAPTLPTSVLDAGVPVLGICYGLQLLAHTLGGQVSRGTEREYGPALLTLDEGDLRSTLFADLPSSIQVWMSHGDRVAAAPPWLCRRGPQR
jgi:GMP synthase (glutamine-hydrolysing)